MIKKLSLIAILALSLANAETTNPNGEDIFSDNNDRTINNYADKNIKINPLGLGSNAKASEESINLNDNYQTNINYQNQVDDTYNSQAELSKEEIELLKRAVRNQNLNALQQKFFNKKYSGYENTQELNYEENKTQKIRTRFAMATTLIFETEIDSYILGDNTGFMVQEIPDKANAIAIKPLLIGVDTSLTIFTKDKKIHTFYVFSTDYKNQQDPSFIIYIKDKESKALLDEKAKLKAEKYLIIEDGIAQVLVDKNEIYKGYIQKAKKENEWLLSAEIFSDKKFTYFKYKKDEMPQVPAIFALIDKQDSPVETRIIGDYIIAETTNPKFTIKSGEAYVCVERLETQEEKDRKKERKLLNTDSKEYKKAQSQKEKEAKKMNEASKTNEIKVW